MIRQGLYRNETQMMIITTRIFIVCTFLLLIAGCEILGQKDQKVFGLAKSSSIELTNGTDASIYYFVVGKKSANTTDWVQGIGPEMEIKHGQSLTIPYDTIFMKEGEERVVVYWWHALESDGNLCTSERNQFVLKIK